MIALILSVLGIGGGAAALIFVPGLAAAVGKIISKINPLALAIAALTLLAGIQSWRVASWQKQTRAEQAAHVATKANFRSAMADAVRHATDAKRATEARYAELKKDADNDLDTLADTYRARTNAYVAQLRTAQAVASHPRSADLPIVPANPQEPIGPDQDTFVLIPRQDLNILVENQARLVNAQAWVKGLE
jgi:hypothetical protein